MSEGPSLQCVVGQRDSNSLNRHGLKSQGRLTIEPACNGPVVKCSLGKTLERIPLYYSEITGF